MSLYFLCKYLLSSLPYERIFPLLTIKTKVHVKQNNEKINSSFVLCEDIDQ